jgi:hypothetical protein
MKPADVPAELVDAAYPAALAHGIPWHDDAVRIMLAAVLPAHEAMVLRNATKEQWGQMLAEMADKAMAERGLPAIDEAVRRGVDERLPVLAAGIEAAVRTKVAEEIEAEYHRRDIAHGAYLHAAQIARGEGR